MATHHKKLIYLFLIVVFIGAHFHLGSKVIKNFSPTYDEPVHLTAGYIYLRRGDFRYNGYHHPPLAEMWAALPLLFLNPFIPVHDKAWLNQRWTPFEQYRFADKFFYQNRVPSEVLMKWGRIFQLLLSGILGLSLLFFGWREGGPWTGLVAMGFWAFSPTILAHGTLVTTDMAFCLFFFLFFAGFSLLKKSWGAVLMGLFLGLCLASKFLAISLFPIIGLLMIWKFSPLGKDMEKGPLKTFFEKKIIISGIIITFTGFVILVGIYRFSSFDIFWDGFKLIVTRSQSGRSSFLWGEYRNTGWISYFPIAFLIKTPIPVLLGLFLSFWLFVRKKIIIPYYIWIPPVAFFLLAVATKVQIGHRHILAIYPFIFIILALGISSLRRSRVYVGLILLGWLILDAFRIQPNYLPFFNQFVGGSKNGFHYLTDSNVDWGQGLELLGQELSPEDKKNGIYLSYFGVADPHAYGISYLDVLSDKITNHKDDSDKIKIKPKKFALSLTNLQATYYRNKNVFSWLSDYNPSKTVGHSIFIYDFTDQPKAIQILEGLRKPLL